MIYVADSVNGLLFCGVFLFYYVNLYLLYLYVLICVAVSPTSMIQICMWWWFYLFSSFTPLSTQNKVIIRILCQIHITPTLNNLLLFYTHVMIQT